MKFVHPLLQSAIEFDSQRPLILYVENAHEFADIVTDLIEQIECGMQGKIILTDKDTQIKAADIEYIGDLASYDCNKKLSAKLLAQMSQSCLSDEELNAQFIKVRGEVNALFARLAADNPLPLEFDNTDIVKLLKMGNPKAIIDKDSMASKLCDIIKVLSITKSAKLIALVNSMCYFRDRELDGIIHMSSYYHVPLMFFEGYHSDELSPNTKNVIIDSDLCVIVV